MSGQVRPAGEWDEIDELRADVSRVLSSHFVQSHELAMARTKLDEFCYWLRRAKEKEGG